MIEQLMAQGVAPVGDEDDADVVVINTCTVTREATKASRSAIRRAIRTHPNAKVVVVGCYAVSDPDEVKAIEGVDLIVGNDEKERFAELLAHSAPTAPLLQVGMRRSDPPETAPFRIRANLKAQTGCDEWCSFCIIPTTRGPLRSLDEDGLLREARTRVEAGAREIVLTGVHLGKYFYDKGGNERDLLRLFERLLGIEGLWRLRLSSILSNHLTDDVIDFIATEDRMCPYLHVPMQAGHDEVLAAMNRPYRIGPFIEAVSKAKERIDGLALATDIIVGFPGETEEQFQATLDVTQAIAFSKLHVFRYSERGDTAATRMGDTVSSEIKKDRSKRLIDLGNEVRSRFLEDHLGQPLEVLVEDEREIDGVMVSSGQTGDYVRAWFEGGGMLGRMVTVVGDRVRADGLAAHVLEEANAR